MRHNNHDLVGLLNVVHAERGQSPGSMALSSIAEGAIVEDQGDGAQVLNTP